MNIRDAIEKNEAHQRKLKAQRTKLLSDERSEAKKLLARQKIILGGWLMSKDPAVVKKIVGLLDREQDRAAFDMRASAEEKSDLSAFSRVDIPLPIGDGPSVPTGSPLDSGTTSAHPNLHR